MVEPRGHLHEEVSLNPHFHDISHLHSGLEVTTRQFSFYTGLVLNLYELGQICKRWFLWQGTEPGPSTSLRFK